MKHYTFLDMDRPSYYVELRPIGSEAGDWLSETPGQGYTIGSWGVYFYSQADATLFALKWS